MTAADPYADPTDPALPATGFVLDPARAALVLTDPQIDFLSPDGVSWPFFGASITENGTVEHIGELLAAAKAAGLTVAVSPHFYYPSDHAWRFGGPLEKTMHAIGMFARRDPLSGDGLPGSGADFLPAYADALRDGETVIASPHKVYGPETNDLVLQLRKRDVTQVLLAGMAANLCLEAHLRELVEQGFEVVVVRDATAGPRVPEGDGYLAATINWRFLAHAVWTTADVVKELAR